MLRLVPVMYDGGGLLDNLLKKIRNWLPRWDSAMPIFSPAGVDMHLGHCEARRTERDDKKIEAAKAMTFDACAAAYIEAHKAGWKNAKHREQWPNT
jgi:hypothetical protein